MNLFLNLKLKLVFLFFIFLFLYKYTNKMYSEYTKAELINILCERDNEIEELKQKYEALKSNYDEDTVTYDEMIDELQKEIKRIKDKYENTDFRKFMNTYGDIAEKMQIDRIKEKVKKIKHSCEK